MSLSAGFHWTYKNIHLVGYTVAGVSTSIAFPEADVLFDVAQGLPFQMPYGNILITHAHLDHAAGLPYLIAQKSMLSLPKPRIYMPEVMVGPVTDIMRSWEKVEDHQYPYEFIVPKADQEYPLKGNYIFKTFPTFHRVPSQGYTVFEKKKRLKAEYQSLAPHQLSDLRNQGTVIEDWTLDPVVSFTGDTKIEYLDATPWLKDSKVLLTEVTFIDQKKPVENARQWGHIHFDELLPRLASLRCERVVLIHLSARYSTKEVKAMLEARVPEHLRTKIEIFPRPI